jgi:hypothetical protein
LAERHDSLVVFCQTDRLARAVARAYDARVFHPGACLTALLAVAAAGADEPHAELLGRAGGLRRAPLSELATPAADLAGAVLVRFVGLDVPRWDAGVSDRAWLQLASGDGLAARVLGGDGDDLELRLVGGVELRLTLDDVASLVFGERVPALWASPVTAPEQGDRLYRRQGDGLDQLDGTVQELTREGVRLHDVVGSRVIPWREVAALFIESLDGGDQRAAPGAPGMPVVADLCDGGRLRGRLLRLDESRARLALRHAEVELPLAALAALALDDGSVAFLSDLDPSEAGEGAPFGDDLGMRWPHRRDRSVTGGPLTAGGRVHTRGLGVHAPSRIAWSLDGGWRRLLGAVAIDDEVLVLAARGSVVFRILVDGRTRWESPVVRGGDAPVALPELDLAGGRELVLEVDPASDLFVADRADWLLMMLVR